MIAPALAMLLMMVAGACLAFVLVVLVWLVDRAGRVPQVEGFSIHRQPPAPGATER